jgi:flagellar biosynthesis GTPase FlhF
VSTDAGTLGKTLESVLGANHPVRYLSTGQNIPGDLCAASAEIILARQFPQAR